MRPTVMVPYDDLATLDDIDRIRDGLKNSDYDGVSMECFNRRDAEKIWASLSDTERDRVLLKWPGRWGNDAGHLTGANQRLWKIGP